MRIFYATHTTPNALFQSNLWRDNLYQPLVDLGHDVVEFDYDLSETFLKVDTHKAEQRKFIARNRPLVSHALLQQVQAAHAVKPLDLFFSYFYDACVLPETLDVIRSMGIKTVNWYCNGSYQLHLVQEISPHYDWCLVPEKFRLADYEAMGARPIYCQEAANPEVYRPYDLPQEYDVSFVGQAYGDRPAYIQYLVQQDIDVRVWGFGWRERFAGDSSIATEQRPPAFVAPSRTPGIAQQLMQPANWKKAAARVARQLGLTLSPAEEKVTLSPVRIGGVLDDQALIQMYSRSRINLGFSTCGETHRKAQRIVQVRLRDFEVPMSGGFYMVEYMPELEEFFAIDKEIVCYENREDLAAKIKYFLAHETERETIRRAGYERCRRDHTWHRRFQVAFAQMGLGEMDVGERPDDASSRAITA